MGTKEKTVWEKIEELNKDMERRRNPVISCK